MAKNAPKLRDPNDTTIRSVGHLPLKLYADSIGKPVFDASETPMLLVGSPFSFGVHVMDPDVLRELYTSKNFMIDKQELTS